MGKTRKKSGNGLLRWIFGFILVLIIIAGINTAIKDDRVNEDFREAAQQTAETNLIETQVRAEEAAQDEGSELEDNNPEDSDSIDGKLAGYKSPADNNPSLSEIPSDENLTIHFLDVGQGDSILLEYGGKSMLIDAGERDQGSGVSAYLYEQDISGIDYVVATHPHSDHIGGMNEILNNFPVGNFIDSGFPHTSKTYENILTTIDEKDIPFEVAEKGKGIEFDPAVDIEVLNPGPEYSDEINENSIVLKISYGEVSFLLMGDAGLETEEKLMKEGYDLNTNILKVGHHASRSGSGANFISAVSPDISIIEVGAGNDYGHPHSEVLERLQKASRVYRTDLDGSIVVTTDGSTYTVTAQKTGSGEGVTATGTAINEANSLSPLETQETGSEDRGPENTELEEAEPGAESGESGTSNPAEPAIYISNLNLQDEWVEITNRSPSPVSLGGWKIEDEGGKHTYTFASYTLGSQATVILYTGKGMNTATELYWGSGNPIWNNDGDTASLYDNSGNPVSSLER